MYSLIERHNSRNYILYACMYIYVCTYIHTFMQFCLYIYPLLRPPSDVSGHETFPRFLSLNGAALSMTGKPNASISLCASGTVLV